jgi:hypothetical protein
VAVYPAVLKKLLRTHLRESVVDVEWRSLAALQLWAISAGASMWIIDLQPYEHGRVVGVVRRLRVDPADGCIEATVSDGTGEVAARWPIRASACELAAAPGTAVLLEGVAVPGKGGKLTLQEPELQIIPGPASE